ncbi:hypothetical protein M3Y95_00746800 [Aphelenchoides besseyi]|nr:hypothetical protein M3Y95_00746800 [Aphelenchoides besseyi]
MHISILLVVFVKLVVCANARIARELSATEIPGCPDVNSLTKSIGDLEREQLDQIRCVCLSHSGNEEERQTGIQVNCVFGSTLDDLAKVLLTISELNRTVHHINLNHVNVVNTTTTLFDALDVSATGTLNELEIRNCHGGSLNVEGRSNKTAESTVDLSAVRTLTIENCGVEQFPRLLIESSPKLESVSLTKNKLQFISRNDLELVAETLEYLDLTENLISDVDDGAFKQLKQLKTLLIGEHNSANNTMIEELAKMKNLETLDLTRIDGVEDSDQIQMIKDNNLKRLILTGCNIKWLNASSFSTLQELQELDMRVNLIEVIEANSFVGLSKLQRLTLAGNFLREFEVRSDSWNGLNHLEELDLGWNELRKLNSRAFDSDLRSNLRLLSLRSNEKLTEIEPNAFDGLVKLETLNLSGSALRSLNSDMFEGLELLRELDVSHNNLSEIDNQTFSSVTKTLRVLNLSGNKLKTLNVDVIRDLNLTELNIGDNPWLCDRKLFEIVNWIKKQYSDGAKNSREFLLANAANTTCHRPYSLQGRNVMELKDSEVPFVYDYDIDTTTAIQPTETTTFDPNDNSTLNVFDLSKLSINVGESNDTFEVNVDEGKPIYDINSIRYGQRPVKNSTNTKRMFYAPIQQIRKE